MSEAVPPPIVPQIIHTPSEQPPSSPTSSSCSSIATDDISDSGEDLPATMEPSDFDFLSHGDLRSPGREFARERSLRKKAPHRHTSSTSVQSPPPNPGAQPVYPSDDEDKRKLLTPEERSKARKKAKKAAKAEKKKALKSQETVKNPRKREDRRREDDIAAVEAEMAALKTQEQPEAEQNEETGDVANNSDRQRRRSSNALARPAKPRKTSSSNQGGGGGAAAVKSPKIGAEADEAPSPTPGKRGNAKHAAAFTQYHVEEGMHVHEKSNDIDFQMATLAKMEALNERSRGGKLARGLEELEKRKMERKRDEALKGVVDTAQERYEDEKLARLYGLK